MAIVGTAYVAVKTISTGLAKQIARDIEKAAKDPEVTKAAEKMGDSISDGVSDGIKEGVDKAAKDSDISKASEDIGGSIGDGIAHGVKDSEKDITKVVTEVSEKAGDEAGRTTRDKIKEHGHRAGSDGELRSTFHLLGNLIGDDVNNGLFKRLAGALPKFIGDLGKQAGSEMGQMVSGAVGSGMKLFQGGIMSNPYVMGAAGALGLALVSAIGPAIAGALAAAVPAAIAAAGGFAAVGGAIALSIVNNMSAVKLEFGKIKDDWMALGQSMGDGIAGGVMSALRNLSNDLLPVMRNVFTNIQDEIAEISGIFGSMFDNARAQNNLQKLMEVGADFAVQLSGAFANVVDALVAIGAAAGPILTRLGNYISNIAEKFADWIADAQASGKLTEYLDYAADSAAALWDILMAVGDALSPIFEQNFGDTGFLEGIAAMIRGMEPFVALLMQLGDLFATLIQILAVAMAPVLMAFMGTIEGITGVLQGLDDALEWALEKFHQFLELPFVTEVLGFLGIEMGNVGDKSADAAGDLDSAADSMWNTSDAGAAMSAELDNVVESWDKFGSAFDKAEDAALAVKNGFIDLRTKMAEGNLTTDEAKSKIRDLSDRIQANTQAQIDNGMSVDDATKLYGDQRDELVKVATQFFGTKKEAEEYVDQLLKTPEEVKTELVLDTSNAISSYDNFYDKYNGKTITQNMQITMPGGYNVKYYATKKPIKNQAEGGVVYAQPGGTIVRVAEAGQNERIEPLDKAGMSDRDYALIKAMAKEAGGATEVRVYIGETELTDIIRTESIKREGQVARRVTHTQPMVGLT